MIKIPFKIHLLAVVLLMICCACTKYNMSKPDSEAAYIAIVQGELKKARQYLKGVDDIIAGKFIQVCVEIEEGNLLRAKHYAKELVNQHSGFEDGQVMVSLLDRRQLSPKETWLVSFAYAWRAAGSPRLTIEETFSNWEEENKVRQSLAITPDALLLRQASSFSNQEILKLGRTVVDTRSPTEIKLLVLQALDNVIDRINPSMKQTTDLVHDAKSIRRKILEQLSKENPADMKYALRIVVDDNTGTSTLTQIDIERLEKAMEGDCVGPARKDLYNKYLNHLKSYNIFSPNLQALSLASSDDIDRFCLILRDKILVTADKASPQAQVRLARILDKLGKAYLKRQTVVSFLYGTDLLNAAAKLRHDMSDIQRAQGMVSFTQSLIKNARTAPLASTLWPIQSLRSVAIEQMVDNEVSVYLLFTGMELPHNLQNLLTEGENN